MDISSILQTLGEYQSQIVALAGIILIIGLIIKIAKELTKWAVVIAAIIIIGSFAWPIVGPYLKGPAAIAENGTGAIAEKSPINLDAIFQKFVKRMEEKVEDFDIHDIKGYSPPIPDDLGKLQDGMLATGINAAGVAYINATKNPIAPDVKTLKAEWPMLKNTKVEDWSPKFQKDSEKSFSSVGNYLGLDENGHLGLSFRAGSVDFGVNIYSDIKNYRVFKDLPDSIPVSLITNQEALKSSIVGLAWSNYNQKYLVPKPMQSQLTVIVSNKKYVTTNKIDPSLSPEAMLMNYFSDVDISGQKTNGMTTLEGNVILLALGDCLRSWNDEIDFTVYDVPGSALGKELAATSLAHELTHRAYYLEDELDTTLASLTIAIDFGQNIFEIAAVP